MPSATSKKPTKHSASKKVVKKDVTFTSRLVGSLTIAQHRLQNFQARRPHRSFRRTYRRDYVRSLQLPGYWIFTNYVFQTLWKKRRLFGLLALTYAVITGVVVGISSQDTYSQLTNALQQTGGDVLQGGWGEIGKASLLLMAAVTGGANETPTEGQQIYGGLLMLLVWLTTVWLLRNIMAGHNVRLRDGLYSAGAPILSTFLVSIVLLVQLLPLGLAFVGYSAAISSGLLSGGVAAMVFWTVALLLSVLSLYWITSTIIALVIVTLPGMYPLKAIKTAGDLVIGRRIRILLRLLWMLLVVVVIWVIIMVPIIIFDTWLKGIWTAIAGVPVVPVILLAMSSATVIWMASYVYLLYRKVVDDDAQPA